MENLARAIRPVEDFAGVTADVARAARVDVVICVTESGKLFLCIRTRHVNAVAVTARTESIAVVASATDGNVRVFAHGTLAMQLDPEVSDTP